MQVSDAGTIASIIIVLGSALAGATLHLRFKVKSPPLFWALGALSIVLAVAMMVSL